MTRKWNQIYTTRVNPDTGIFECKHCYRKVAWHRQRSGKLTLLNADSDRALRNGILRIYEIHTKRECDARAKSIQDRIDADKKAIEEKEKLTTELRELLKTKPEHAEVIKSIAKINNIQL